jgi:hypothetical protein
MVCSPAFARQACIIRAGANRGSFAAMIRAIRRIMLHRICKVGAKYTYTINAKPIASAAITFLDRCISHLGEV